MAFAIELFFDARLDALIRRVWRDLADDGVPCPLEAIAARPHITMAVAEVLEWSAFIGELQAFAPTCAPLPLRLGHVGTFPSDEGVVFFGVAPTSPLLALHERVWSSFGAHAQRVRDHYAPRTWIPHCTLTYGVARKDLALALHIASRAPLPLDGTVGQIALVDVTPRRATTLAAFPLSAADGGPASERPRR
jgi:2'-5' RNA ligase